MSDQTRSEYQKKRWRLTKCQGALIAGGYGKFHSKAISADIMNHMEDLKERPEFDWKADPEGIYKNIVFDPEAFSHVKITIFPPTDTSLAKPIFQYIAGFDQRIETKARNMEAHLAYVL